MAFFSYMQTACQKPWNNQIFVRIDKSLFAFETAYPQFSEMLLACNKEKGSLLPDTHNQLFKF